MAVEASVATMPVPPGQPLPKQRGQVCPLKGVPILPVSHAVSEALGLH